jgi:hypothetical protein
MALAEEVDKNKETTSVGPANPKVPSHSSSGGVDSLLQGIHKLNIENSEEEDEDEDEGHYEGCSSGSENECIQSLSGCTIGGGCGNGVEAVEKKSVASAAATDMGSYTSKGPIRGRGAGAGFDSR